MPKKYDKVLKKRSGYSFKHPKTGKKVVVPSHKQHYRVRIYRDISRSQAKEEFEKRSERAKSIDKANRSKNTKDEPDEEWLENINRTDIEGIDTPSTHDKKTPKDEKELKKDLEEIEKKLDEIYDEKMDAEWGSKEYEQLEDQYYTLLNKKKDLENSLFYKTHSLEELASSLDLPKTLSIQKNPSWGYRLYSSHDLFDETEARWEPSDPITLSEDTLKGVIPEDIEDWDDFTIETKDILDTREMKRRIKDYTKERERKQRRENIKQARKQYKEKKEKQKKQKLIKKAKQTGKKQLLETYPIPCQDPHEECNIDTVRVYIDEKGNITETSHHTW